MGEWLYFTGASQTFSTGDKVAHRQRGQVVGPATSESHKGKGLAMKYPDNKGNVNTYLTELSREAPVRVREGWSAVGRAAARLSRGVNKGGLNRAAASGEQ